MAWRFASRIARMREFLALLFGRSDRPIDRGSYLRVGLALMALKYLVDAALIGLVAGVFWTPIDYLLPMISFNAAKIAGFPTGLNIALLVWALPFIWIGVSLSVRRAIDAGIFPGVVVTFFLPFLNYLLMAALALAPTRVRAAASPPISEPAKDARAPSAGIGHSGRVGVLAGAVTGLVAAGVGVVALRTYGGSVFLGTPFVIGLVGAFVANRLDEKTRSESIVIGQVALLATGGTLMLLALEGMVCLVMALPVASPIALLGSIVGHVLAQHGRPTSISHISMLFCLLFLGTAIDAAMPAPGARIVTTAIDIDAPADVVWQHVTSFGDITTPPRWLFRTGLAYPIRARLEGTGVGAVRHCEFTTGAFVEPITGWDAPRRLAFDVIAQPPPLQEWSPYSRVFAPHLDGFFRTSHGEFRLVPLDNGRTRLEGRTWYNLDMQPATYWTALADNILHAIHDRVLEHIKVRAEERNQPHTGGSRLPRASTGGP
jgi:hypothetical protein